MLARALWRHQPAVWICPVLVLLVVLLAPGGATSYEPYPPALTFAGTSPLFLVAAVCAACAAWEGGRWRRADWFWLPHVRSVALRVVVSVVPSVAAGVLAMLAGVAAQFAAAGVVRPPDLRIIGVAVATIVAWSLLGFALGVLVRTVVAVPAALIAGYAWLALPPAVEPLWLRHLTGSLPCCGLNQDLAPVAVAAALVFAGGLAVTSALLLRHPLGPATSVAALPIVFAVAVGSFLVHTLGPDPTIPRSPGALVCAGTTPRVCVWPEHRARLQEVTALAADATRAWRRVGIEPPAVFSEQASTAVPPGTADFGFSSRADQNVIRLSLASALVPDPPPCAERGPYPGGEVTYQLVAWFGVSAGVPLRVVDDHVGSDEAAVAARVLAMPVGRQRDWVRRNLAATRDCVTKPWTGAGP